MGEGLAEQCGMPPFKPGKSRKSRADSPDKSRESTTARAFATAMLLAMARSAEYVHVAGGELWEEYDGSAVREDAPYQHKAAPKGANGRRNTIKAKIDRWYTTTWGEGPTTLGGRA